MKYFAYTDGSCIPNTGSGAVAIVVADHHNNILWEHTESYRNTDSNRMELLAVHAALAFFHGHQLVIRTDSSYVHRTASAILSGQGCEKPKSDRDIWEEIDELISSHTKSLEISWLRGHSGHPCNTRADKLARAAARQLHRGVKPYAKTTHKWVKTLHVAKTPGVKTTPRRAKPPHEKTTPWWVKNQGVFQSFPCVEAKPAWDGVFAKPDLVNSFQPTWDGVFAEAEKGVFNGR